MCYFVKTAQRWYVCLGDMWLFLMLFHFFKQKNIAGKGNFFLKCHFWFCTCYNKKQKIFTLSKFIPDPLSLFRVWCIIRGNMKKNMWGFCLRVCYISILRGDLCKKQKGNGIDPKINTKHSPKYEAWLARKRRELHVPPLLEPFQATSHLNM